MIKVTSYQSTKYVITFDKMLYETTNNIIFYIGYFKLHLLFYIREIYLKHYILDQILRINVGTYVLFVINNILYVVYCKNMMQFGP